MLDPIASPGDPIFYLHHTWLDKVFWGWQSLDLPARLTDIGGPNTQFSLEGFPEVPGQDSAPGTGGATIPPFLGGFRPDDPPIIMPPIWAFPPGDAFFPRPGSPPQRPEGDPKGVTTLNHILNMFSLIPNATIADVMDIGGPLLCYEYL